MIEAIFDACFGADARHLPKWPASMDFVNAGWDDGDGRKFKVDHLHDVEEAYRAERTAVIHFSGHRQNGLRCDFEFHPGPPRPRARLAVEGDDSAVANAIAAVRAVFPLPHDGAMVFLSWGGERSRKVAEALRELLSARFPVAEIFLSTTSIDPGEDPLREILDRGLKNCQVLVAVLTEEAAQRPWVIWETATAWARDKLVVPIFVGVKPSSVSGPLTIRVQGVGLDSRSDLDRALVVMSTRLQLPKTAALSEEEHLGLLKAAASDHESRPL